MNYEYAAKGTASMRVDDFSYALALWVCRNGINAFEKAAGAHCGSLHFGPPDFLSRSVALMNFMRLAEKK
ncbi:MAG: hypothetical protein QOJ42_6610 [Acidobacteriaceae bacterium]|jgi:hypothetical protein|nr:hypothetical protein [Acidobacteriaceae bacterium]